MKPSIDPPKKILVITVEEAIGEIAVSMLRTAVMNAAQLGATKKLSMH